MNKIASTQHIPVLDGIRGIAILMVIVTHTFGYFKMLGGAYANDFEKVLFFVFGYGGLGVDLFFVLSGYLITGILINSRDEQKYFVNFYARRTLRIFPIYYLYISIVIFVLPMFIPYMRSQTDGYLSIYYLYLQNLVFFVNESLTGFLFAHLWSLAVEEHFYLIWPLVVYKVNDRKIFHIGISVIIVAVLLRIYFLFFAGFRAGAVEFFAFKSTFCRADAIIFGAMLAYAVRNEILLGLLQRYRMLCLYGSGLLALSTMVYIYLHNQSITIGNSSKAISCISNTLFPLFFTFVIYGLLNAKQESIGRRFFDNSVMRFFGKYSYAMYVVHYPVIAFIYANFLENSNYDPMSIVLILFVATITITSVISWLSYHLMEKHFLSLKRFFVSGRHEPKLEKIALENV